MEKYILFKDQFYREIFQKEKLWVQLQFNLLTEMFMKESGKIIKLKVLVYINIIQELFIRVIGKKICKVELELKFGLTTADMRDHI